MQVVLSPLMAEVSYVVESLQRETPATMGSSAAFAQAFGLLSMAFAAGVMVGPVRGYGGLYGYC